MIIAELQQTLGVMYREVYKDEPLIRELILEMGWAIDRLLKRDVIVMFDEYENVREVIEQEMKWRQSDGNYRKST
nr:MAG TPA_asm: hemocyanin beta-sandwich [Caudoviricetes sp.]